MSANIVPHTMAVTPQERQVLYGHPSYCLWFTGLSGAGKSTLANYVERRLYEREIHSFLLDGDNVRHGLCRDLAFSAADRHENIRRVAEVANLFVNAGLVVITSLISPFRFDRQVARQLIGEERFIEVYVRCPLDVCSTRDPKGLYKRALAGAIPDFTGVSSPYEEPERPEITVDSSVMTVEESGDVILTYLDRLNLLT